MSNYTVPLVGLLIFWFIVAIIFIGVFVTREKCPLCADAPCVCPISPPCPPTGLIVDPSKYEFTSMLDSNGGDLFQVPRSMDSKTMQYLCDITPDCKGYNNWGYYKNAIKPKSEWAAFGEVPADGFYLKK